MSSTIPSTRVAVMMLSLVILAIAAYFLPWITIRNTASLSMTAYDLAEWASLHPNVPDSAFGPLATLLLRLPLACLGLIAIIFIARLSKQPTVRVLFTITVAIALLPPLEFFTVARDDMNYRQQFMLALSTLLIGIICVQSPTLIRAKFAVIALAMLALIIGLLGQKMANDLLNAFILPNQAGHGAIILPIVLLSIILQETRIKTG